MFDKPFYTPSTLQPPGYIFSLGWMLIYPLIGVSGIFIFNEQPQLGILWCIQLILNLTWVPGLFIMRNLWLSLLHLLLLVSIVLLIYLKSNAKIRAVMTPYLLWLIFATTIFMDTVLAN